MSRLGVPAACAGSSDGRTTGMFDEATMAELWGDVGTAVMAGTHMA
jgi:hypothetical protein